MERQLANLTGLVQKALTQAPPPTRDFLVPPGRESFRGKKNIFHSVCAMFNSVAISKMSCS